MSKVIPFGDRILVKRRKIGEKAGSIIMPDQVKERDTDLAEVIYIPELTFSDKEILDNAEQIVKALTEKAIAGNDKALIALLRINEFVKMKSIKVGDGVLISKYVGVTLHETGETEDLTLVNSSDVIGLVMKEEAKDA